MEQITSMLFQMLGLEGRKAKMTVDIPDVDKPGEFMVKTGDIVTINEFDDENDMIIVENDKWRFPIEGYEAELVEDDADA